MQRLLRHKFLVGTVAVLVAVTAGGAYAATQSGTTPRQAFLNDVAKRLNVSPSQLRSALTGALLDRLQAAVKAGVLTQAQADHIKQWIQQGGALPLGAFGLGRGWRLGRGFGPGGPGPRGFGPGSPGPRGFGPGGAGPRGFGPAGPFGPRGPGGVRHGLLGTAAQYLGLSETRLLGDLQGKTLAQVAKAQNKSVSGLEQALTSEAKSRLGKLAAAGWITKAQEQRMLSRLSARISRLVNQLRIPKPPLGPANLPPMPVPPAGASAVPGPGAPPPSA